MACGVYVLSFPSGKFYVGSSGNIASRVAQHRQDLIAGEHINLYVQEQWRLYMQFDVYEYYIDGRESAYDLEQSFIDTHNKNPFLLNIQMNARGGSSYTVHTGANVESIKISTVKAKTYMSKQAPFKKRKTKRKATKRKPSNEAVS